MLREDQRLSTKGRTFRNTATYQKLRGGVPSTPSPCTTVGVWICLYVRLLINPNQNFMDFPYYRSIRKCEKRFVKLFACKTTVLENSFSIKAELSCETKTCRLVTAELGLMVSVKRKRANTAFSTTNLWVYATRRQKEEDGKKFVCDKRDRSITYLFCGDLHLSCFLVFCKREVRRNSFSNKIIFTLVTQGLPSSFLSRTVA